MTTIQFERSLEGQLFWVGGASSGIGYAVAELLAKRGADLILMARSREELQKKADALIKEGAGDVSIAPLDISDPESGQRARELVEGRKLRGILANGGGPRSTDISKLDWADFVQANALLLAGPANLINNLMPFVSAPGGSIVALSATTVKEPLASLPMSAAYRSGLRAYLKCLSDISAPRGIRVNVVSAGLTSTDALTHLMEEMLMERGCEISDDGLRDIHDEWSRTIPLRRLATPAEVARACVYLLSDESSYITGQTHIVDGGMTRGY